MSTEMKHPPLPNPNKRPTNAQGGILQGILFYLTNRLITSSD
jgi:hypothetical protein